MGFFSPLAPSDEGENRSSAELFSFLIFVKTQFKKHECDIIHISPSARGGQGQGHSLLFYRYVCNIEY